MSVTPERQALYDKLEELRTLEEGWDSHDGKPLRDDAYEMAKSLIGMIPEALCGSAVVVPNAMGTVQIEWHEAGRSLELEIEPPNKVHYLIDEEKIVGIEDTDCIAELYKWIPDGARKRA